MYDIHMGLHAESVYKLHTRLLSRYTLHGHEIGIFLNIICM